VTLLVPQHIDVELDVEFQNVKACAATNCLKLNLSKTKEIVFKWPRVQYFHMPPLVDIEQLDCCKLLGVIFQSNFKMNSHILFILSQCAQRQYLLRLLHRQGLPDAELSVIAFAVIISRLLYALPAWGGFLSVELVNGINAFFRRMQHFGYLQCCMTVAELMNKSDNDLFCKLCAPTHALNHLLPPARIHASLRTRGHSYQLPEYSADLHKKSFLIRSLYSFVK